MIDLWYRNAVIYSLDVDSFADSDGDGVGDFRGLERRLDYLAGLGATCLWLLPFFPSPNRDNGYDVTDYYGVDPRLGTLGDFVEFAHQARERGIRVLIDLVVNHTSDRHPWFQAARSDPDSRYRDYYIWSDEPPLDAEQGVVFPGVQQSTWSRDEAAGCWYHHRFYRHQPDLNIGNPEVREEICRIMGFWLQLGVSGFRVDAAPFLVDGIGAGSEEDSFALLRDLSGFLSWRRGDAIMLAEANVPPEEALRYFGDNGGMHMLFNFHANQRLFLSLARRDAGPLKQAMQELPDPPRFGQWANFLRNHDELDLGRLSEQERQDAFAAFAPDPGMRLYGRGVRRRLAPLLDGEQQRLELAFSLLFSLPGTPVLWYGEEIGMGDDLELPERTAVRTPMQWSGERNAGFSAADAEALIRPVVDDGPFAFERVNVAGQMRREGSLLRRVQRFVELRRGCAELGWGAFEALDCGAPEVLLHRVSWRGLTLIAAHNFSAGPRRVRLPLGGAEGELLDLFGEDRRRAPPPAEDPEIELPGFGYRWFRIVAPSAADPGLEAV